MSEEQDNFKEELALIDERIEALKRDVELNFALEELHKNEYFNLVISDAYFEKESKRIFELLTTPTTLTRDQIENLNEKLLTIRTFKKFFQTIIVNATMAPEQIDQEMEYRAEFTAKNSSLMGEK